MDSISKPILFPGSPVTSRGPVLLRSYTPPSHCVQISSSSLHCGFPHSAQDQRATWDSQTAWHSGCFMVESAFNNHLVKEGERGEGRERRWEGERKALVGGSSKAASQNNSIESEEDKLCQLCLYLYITHVCYAMFICVSV